MAMSFQVKHFILSAFLLFLFWIVPFGIIAQVNGIEDAPGQCYPCNSLNRKWESLLCENDVSDCGDCYIGFKTLTNSADCVPEGERIVKNATSAIILKGNSVVLHCEWTRPIVECIWLRGGIEIDDGGRYQKSSTQQTECSIKIVDFKEIDVGEWSCNIYDGTHPNDPSHVTHSWLFLKESKLLYVKERETAVVPIGESVVLMCHIEQRVDCSWTRSEIIVEMYSRYRYADDHGNDKIATDCSIRIDDFQEIDVGSWQCQSQVDSSHEGIIPRRRFFELRTTGKAARQIITGIPNKQNVTIGSNLTLSCGYDIGVICVWEKNGHLVQVRDRYHYSAEGKGRETENCSLEIISLSAADLGEWKCGYRIQQMSHYKVTASTHLLVTPEVNLTVDLTLYVCTVSNGFPEADIYWQINDKVQNVKQLHSLQENGLYTTSSILSSPLTPSDILICIVQHPAWNQPKLLIKGPLVVLRDESMTSDSTVTLPDIGLISITMTCLLTVCILFIGRFTLWVIQVVFNGLWTVSVIST